MSQSLTRKKNTNSKGNSTNSDEASALVALAQFTKREAAEAFVKSGFFPDAKQVAQALTKLVYGQSLGLSAAESMSGLYIVKGRVSMSYPTIGRLIKTSGRYDYTVKEHTDKKCSIEFLKKREFPNKDGKMIWEWVPCGPDSVFTIEEAKIAGLTSNETWRKYPKNMLFARCLSNGARYYCPDALGGTPVYLPDELPNSGLKVDYDTGEVVDAEEVEGEVVETVTTTQVIDNELIGELNDLVKKTNTDLSKFLTHYNVKSETELSESSLKHAVALLKQKLKSM